VSFHGEPRYTKDLDPFVGSSPENLQRLASALAHFGAPSDVVRALPVMSDDEIAFFGVPPARVDILRKIEGVDFAAAYARRVSTDWEGVRVSILGLDDLIANKRAVGRERDAADVRTLERIKRLLAGQE
jgi:hypothetical protein